MSGIRLSEKHGLNPTIPICPFCGKEKNEIALLGKLPDDTKAPMYAIIDHEPCDECKNAMSKGVTLIEVQDKPKVKNQSPINKNHYMTSRWLVITNEAGKRIFDTDEKTLLIDTELFSQFIEQA